LTTHNAPPVVYPLGRSRFLGVLLLGLWLCGLLLVLAWFFLGAGLLDWRIALALACVLGAGAAAYAGWRNAPAGQLAWDGEVWRWESPGYQAGVAEYGLSVLADFQHALLLRLENQAHACLWLWMERRSMPERWLDLRRAVYSPHKSLAAPWAHDALHANPQPAVAVSGPMHPVDGTTNHS
jgi:toxin CptA